MPTDACPLCHKAKGRPCRRCLGSTLTPFVAYHYPPATAAFLSAGIRRDHDGNGQIVCPRCDGGKVEPDACRCRPCPCCDDWRVDVTACANCLGYGLVERRDGG